MRTASALVTVTAEHRKSAPSEGPGRPLRPRPLHHGFVVSAPEQDGDVVGVEVGEGEIGVAVPVEVAHRH